GRSEFDIVLEGEFKAKWNLVEDNIWAINPKSFEEVGCIHTAQGLEFDYVGVFIGKDLYLDPDTGCVKTNKCMISKDDKTSGIRTSPDEIADKLIKNTYKTLLTRGQKGCFIYCEDKELGKYIKAAAINTSK
ncbi:MAG: DNA/RNA helicase domain-containing protein, partial [Saccharofermentanales bacterium]